MLVSHKYKFIFIKTVKTAGTSTEIYLEPYCSSSIRESHERRCTVTEDGIIGSRLLRHRDEYWNHMKPPEIREKVGQEKFDSYIKIANIRNPFDMLVSHYHFEFTRQKYDKSHSLNFNQYILKTKVVEEFSEHNRGFFYIGSDYIVGEVLRQERLVEDLNRLRKTLNLPESSRKLSNYKTSQERVGKHYSAFYTPRGRAMVEEHFAWYLEKFNYRFDQE